MIKHMKYFSFTILILFSSALGALQEKSFNDACAEVEENMRNLLGKHYTIEVMKSSNEKALKIRIFNKRGHEQMMDLFFLLNTDGSMTLKFFNAKKEDVVKRFSFYYSEEMNLQWNAVGELFKRMVHLEEHEERDAVTFNILQDVKAIFHENQNENVKVEETQEEDDLKMYVTYQKSVVMVAWFGVDGMSSEIDEDKKYEEKPFNLLIKYITSVNNEEKEGELKIPIFSNDLSEFNGMIMPFRNALDYAKLINTRSDVETEFSKFMNELIPGVQIIPQRTEQEINLKLSFEACKADVIIKEKPAEEEDFLPFFVLTLTKDGNDPLEIVFKRTSIDSFRKMLVALNIKSRFRTIYDEIMEAFQQKYDETHTAANLKFRLVEGPIGQGYKGLTATDGSTNLLYLAYGELNGVVTLMFNSIKPRQNLTQQFNKSHYKLTQIKSFINYLLQTHLGLANKYKAMM